MVECIDTERRALIGGYRLKDSYVVEGAEHLVHGNIATYYGLVAAYSVLNSPFGSFATLSMIVRGVEHRRRYERFYTPRGLVTKAKQFAKDLHEGKLNTPQD